MDIIQTLATIGLLTLVIYFIMVNVFETGHIKSSGLIGLSKENFEDESSVDLEEIKAQAIAMAQAGELSAEQESQAKEQAKEQVSQAKEQASQAKEQAEEAEEQPISGLNLRMGTHPRTGLGEALPNDTYQNVTDSATYAGNEDTPVKPANYEDRTEGPSKFGSDILNINKFYGNNPEIFSKSMTYVPDVSEWDEKGRAMYNSVAQETRDGPICGYNYEHQYAPLGN